MNRGTIGVELDAAKLGSDPQVMHVTPLVDGRLPLCHAPTPTTALVTSLNRAIVRAISGWVRRAWAVAASGTISGA